MDAGCRLVVRFGLAGGVIATHAVAGQAVAPQWRTSRASAIEIARRVDRSMGSLHQIEGTYGFRSHFDGFGPDLDGQGDDRGHVQVVSPAVFHIEFPHLQDPKFKTFPESRAYISADSKLSSIQGSQVKKTIAPIAKLRLMTASSVADWVYGLPRYILGGIHQESGLSDLVTRTSTPGSGFTTTVEEAHTVLNGRRLGQQRITIFRKPAAAKKLGACRFQIRIDVDHELPVAAVWESTDGKKRSVKFQWAIGWRLHNKPFPANTFKVYP